MPVRVLGQDGIAKNIHKLSPTEYVVKRSAVEAILDNQGLS
jgi:hypothetical protein